MIAAIAQFMNQRTGAVVPGVKEHIPDSRHVGGEHFARHGMPCKCVHALRSLISLLAVICLQFCFPVLAGEGHGSQCGKLREGYRLLEASDLDQFTLDYFNESYGGHPGKVVADFNGDGKDDCAAIYIRENPEGHDYRDALLSFSLSQGQCLSEQVFFLGHYRDIIFASAVKAGTMVRTSPALDDDESAELQYAGVRVVYAGKAELVYFWSDEYKAILSIQTAD